ncbi:MAG TPA: hypothetical protein VMW54_01485 [Terriglobia bacterium]|nr:hypothetical protein [Terriglobia bacterium]
MKQILLKDSSCEILNRAGVPSGCERLLYYFAGPNDAVLAQKNSVRAGPICLTLNGASREGKTPQKHFTRQDKQVFGYDGRAALGCDTSIMEG